LVHGEHGTASGRTNAVASKQRHDGQGATAATGGGAIGEFGGHHHTQAPDRADPVALIPEQQAQAQGIDHPAQQDHAEHHQQPVQRKIVQSRPGFTAAQ
jgi:hypothetical protein